MFQDDNLSNDSTLGSDDDWETASDVESEDSAGNGVIDHMIIGCSSPDADNTGDEGAEDGEVPSHVNNRINELLSNKNPGRMLLIDQASILYLDWQCK